MLPPIRYDNQDAVNALKKSMVGVLIGSTRLDHSLDDGIATWPILLDGRHADS